VDQFLGGSSGVPRPLLKVKFIEKIINQESPEFVIGRIAYKAKINYKKNDSLADHPAIYNNPTKNSRIRNSD
jgi:hypothetical protein